MPDYLLAQIFMARLIVDMGMNDVSVPLKQVRNFINAHTIEYDAKNAAETLRYSTDIYAQALSAPDHLKPCDGR
jgi:hypothetical protein